MRIGRYTCVPIEEKEHLLIGHLRIVREAGSDVSID